MRDQIKKAKDHGATWLVGEMRLSAWHSAAQTPQHNVVHAPCVLQVDDTYINAAALAGVKVGLLFFDMQSCGGFKQCIASHCDTAMPDALV